LIFDWNYVGVANEGRSCGWRKKKEKYINQRKLYYFFTPVIPVSPTDTEEDFFEFSD